MKKRAFTLAEVAVALALLALAAFAFSRAVIDSLDALNYQPTEEEVPIFEIVRREILNIRDRSTVEAGGDIEFPTLVRSRDGDHETVMKRIRWEAEVFPTRVLNVFAAQVRINFVEDEDRPGDLELTFYAFRPRWGTSEEREAIISALEEMYSEREEARGQSEIDE